MKPFVMLSLFVLVITGCGSLGNVSPAAIESDTSKGIQIGLKYALKKWPDKAAQIQKDCQVASSVIQATVLPIFSGAQTGDVLRSAVDQALSQLSSKISPEVNTAISLVVDDFILLAKLPANPATKLDPTMKAQLTGLFQGVVDGIAAVFLTPAPQPPPAPPPAPAPAPPK